MRLAVIPAVTIGEAIRVNVEEAQAAIQAAAMPAINIADIFRQAVEKAHAEIVAVSDGVRKAARRTLEAPEVREGIERALRALEQQHVYYGRIVIALGRRGWYVDIERMGHPDVRDPLDLFEAGEAERAHEFLCVLFEEQMDDVVRQFEETFPDRARHVAQAVAAHRRGEYALSTPVFLLEADGVCQWAVKTQAYAKCRDGQRRIGIAIETHAGNDLFRLAMCAALMSGDQPLIHDPRQRAERGMTDAVNRHAVLHGEDVNYDTRLKSCQAFSFLAHVASVMPDLREAATADSAGGSR
jgi:hypothetical protein